MIHVPQRIQKVVNPNGWSMELLPWPYSWNQMKDPAADGDGGSGPNAANNCGPESVAECINHLRDVSLDADFVWDVAQELRKARGEATGPGYTSWEDLQAVLKEIANVDSVLTTVSVTAQFGQPAVTRLLYTIWKALTLNHPLIGLFSFSAPNAPDGHFRSITGMTPTAVITSDSATGKRRVETYADFWAWSRGSVLEIKGSRAIGK